MLGLPLVTRTTRPRRGNTMGNPLLNAFERKAGAIVGGPGVERTRRGTELALDRILDHTSPPKTCNFRTARTPAEDSDSPQLFATALYVAPERVEGRPATVASDVYGLGLVLYEMLVGKPPFTSANAAVLLRDHVVRPPVPPSHLRPSLPKDVDTIVLKALAKDPALRYQKATEIGDALTKTLQAHTTAAQTHHGFDDYAPNVMTEPLRGLVPRVEQSPLVALLAEYGQPMRRGLYGLLAALPL